MITVSSNTINTFNGLRIRSSGLRIGSSGVRLRSIGLRITKVFPDNLRKASSSTSSPFKGSILTFPPPSRRNTPHSQSLNHTPPSISPNSNSNSISPSKIIDNLPSTITDSTSTSLHDHTKSIKLSEISSKERTNHHLTSNERKRNKIQSKLTHIATLTLSSSHPYTLDLFSQFAQSSANSLSLLTSITSLPTTKELHTVLKSPFVMKKAQENFMRKTHKRMIKVWNGDRVVVDLWSRYLKEGAIGGVGMILKVNEFVEFDKMKEVVGDVEVEEVVGDVEVEEVAGHVEVEEVVGSEKVGEVEVQGIKEVVGNEVREISEIESMGKVGQEVKVEENGGKVEVQEDVSEKNDEVRDGGESEGV